MIVRSVQRPLGCWKSATRQAQQQRQLVRRAMATAKTPTKPTSRAPGTPSAADVATTEAAAASIPAVPRQYKFHTIKTNIPSKPIRTAFAVYSPPPSIRKTHPSPLRSFHAQQTARLDRTGARTALFSRKSRDSVRAGDVLQVSTTRSEPFAGVCLSVRRAGVDTAVLLRNHLMKTGVEMWFKIYSPTVTGIEVVWRRPKRARRARLMYMRKAKHDMGNVDHLVDAWRRARNVFNSRGARSKGKAGGKTTGLTPSKHAKKR